MEKFEIPFDKIPELRKGRDIKLDNGKVIINSDVTKDPTAPFSYAYCTDTRFCSDIVKKLRMLMSFIMKLHFLIKILKLQIKQVILQPKKQQELQKKQMLNVYNWSLFKRYSNLNELLQESKEIFENTFLAKEETF